jgi:hypothetical protein
VTMARRTYRTPWGRLFTHILTAQEKFIHRHTTRRLLWAMVLLLGFVSGAAWTHPKTDIVKLYNGDRLTGEVKTLFGGILEFDTEAMGILKIEWQEITSLNSKYHYEVRLSEGTRYYGTITEGASPGEMQLTDVYGTHNLNWLEVVELRVIEKGFKNRIDIYLSAGYSYTKASSVGQTSFNTEMSYEDEKTRNLLTGRIVNTNTDSGTTTSQKMDLSRSVSIDETGRYRMINGSYETNDEMSLDHRVSLGVGLGKYFFDTHKMRWAGRAGLQILTEKTTLIDAQDQTYNETLQSAELTLTTNFSVWRFDSPELDLNFNFSVYPSLTESGRVRSDTDLRFRWELVEDLFWDITAFGTFDNKDDTENGADFDYGITTGVGWEY